MPRYAHVIVTFPKIWEDFVDVGWEPELLEGNRVVKYHLVATATDYNVERLFDADQTGYRLVGLAPGTEVQAGVRAQFEGGEWGTWCSSSARLHHSAAARVGQVGPDFLHGCFTWGLDDESTATHNWLQAVGFHLRVRQKENVLSSAVCNQELAATQREFAVRGLGSNGVFNVQVRAVSQYGDVGQWSEVVRFLTLCNVEVRVVEVGEDYAVAWWGRQGDEVGAPPASLGSRTAIEQFALRLELEPSPSQVLANAEVRPAVVSEELFTGDVCLKKMQGLLPGRTYGIWSRQLNIQGDWSPWVSTKFRTMSSTSMVNVQSVSDTFLLFSWGQERCEAEGGEVDVVADSQVVNWQVRCVNTRTKEESSVVLPESETSTRIVNLPHATEFGLSVRSKNTYGRWGPWAESTYVSTLSPLRVHVDAVGEGWLKLNWSRKDKGCHDDSIVRYHVQVSAATTPFRLSKYFPAEVMEYRFEDLSPSMEYRISIQACIGDRWQAWSEALPVKTAGPAEVHLVRRGEDFMQVRMTSEYFELNGVDPLDQRYQLRTERQTDGDDTGGGVKVLEFANASSHRITKLAPASRVSLQVRAYNAPQDKWGAWCQPRTISTLPSVITFSMVGETCFEVAWQRKPRMVSAVDDLVPVDNDPLAPADSVMYILRVNEILPDGSSQPLEKYHFTDEDKPFFIVEGLAPSHTYSAQLCTADSQQMWSPWSAPAVVTMMPPLAIEVAEVGEDYCKLSWHRETAADAASAGSSGAASAVASAIRDEPDTKYRIAAAALTLDENGGAAAGAQLKYHVQGDTALTLRHLCPDTSYRISISAYPHKTNVWGVWSRAVYVRTNSTIAVELDAVGEDYAHVSWRRIPPSDDLVRLHPCCEVVSLGAEEGGGGGGGGSATDASPVALRLREVSEAAMEDAIKKNLKPYPLHVADASITQFNVKVFGVQTQADDGDPYAGVRSLEYETYLPFEAKTLRIPNLKPNTDYEVVACSCNPRGEWGVTSTPLPLRTAMSTEMVVSEVTHSHVRVRWGRGVASTREEGDADAETGAVAAAAPAAAAAAPTDSKAGEGEEGGGVGAPGSPSASVSSDEARVGAEKYLLRIVGQDDDLCKEVTVPGDVTEYDIQCLSINCCYSVTVRSLSAGQWGQPSVPIYVALRALRVSLVEASQDWLRLSWRNKALPDGRQKELFITLIGDGRATTRTLPSGSDSEHVFTDLKPLTVYSVHLLCVQQVPSCVKKGGWAPRSEGEAAAAAAAAPAPALPASGRPTDAGITVALPLTAADYSSFYTDSCAFSTLSNLVCEVRSVGENFAAVAWRREAHAHAAEASREREAEYEVSCCVVPGSGGAGAGEGEAPSEICRTVRGNEATLAGLAYNTLYELRLRKVSHLSSAWSKAVAVQTLDKVRVQVGPPGVAADDWDAQVGVGEDFILLNWGREAAAASAAGGGQMSYVVRCVQCGADGKPVEPPCAQEFSTAETHYRLTQLSPDTPFAVSVRSTVMDDGGAPRRGEWSDPLTLCTLSPMRIRVVGITEETAEVRWLRKGEAQEGAPSVHTISSYHLKIHAAPKVAGDPPTLLEERQLLETDPEFAARCVRLTGLKADCSYTATVRASTENSWGAWSTAAAFTTQPLVCLQVNLVGEQAVFLSWRRQPGKPAAAAVAASGEGENDEDADASVVLAAVEACELSVSTVGRSRVHFTRRLPAARSEYRLDGLQPNMQYSLCLRPCYSSGVRGLWCEEYYCCTLAPIAVEVSRIGETFVHVKWTRAPQQRIAARLREQHQQQQHEFEVRQRRLQDDIDALRSGMDDGGVFEQQFLANQQAAGAAAAAAASVATSNKLEQMLKVQQQQQQKHHHLAKLQELQLLELERVTQYPDGDDLRYEVVIAGSSTTGGGGGGGEAEAPPDDDAAAASRGRSGFLFRRRINCTEGKEGGERTCKMDGLQPHSSYTVTVRAMYGNRYCVLPLVDAEEEAAAAATAAAAAAADAEKEPLSPEERERERQEAADNLLWGAWSARAELCTLKQISLQARGVGSTHCVVEWDTGYTTADAATAIVQYQLTVVERDRKKGKPVQDIIISDAATASWTVVDLQVNTLYTVTVRVCYDDDRWGLWSNAIAFLTLPELSATVKEVTETSVTVLVWREQQTCTDKNVLVWRPAQSEMQLAINDIPSPSTFKLDLDTSTLLTLDDLTIDSLYKVKSREVDANGEWRGWQDVVSFETLAAAPSKPTLDERRGNVISLSWNQRQNRMGVVYLYRVCVLRGFPPFLFFSVHDE